MGTFSNKLALITGGAGGIGVAIARLWLDRGGPVSLLDISADRLNATAWALNDACVSTQVSQLDTRSA